MGASICIDRDDYLKHRQNWDYAIMNFPVETLYVCRGRGKEDIRGRVTENAVYISDLTELPYDAPMVVLEPRGSGPLECSEPLSSFEHPGSAIYHFGPNSHEILPEHFARRTPGSQVYIDRAAHRDMWSWMAWVIVAYDRLTKRIEP